MPVSVVVDESEGFVIGGYGLVLQGGFVSHHVIIVFGAHDRVQLVRPLQSGRGFHGISCFAGISLFGSHKDNAVGGTRTVDGSGSGVFQHFDRGYVRHIECGKPFGDRVSVDNNQRRTVGTDRPHTADTDLRGGSGFGGGILDVDTSDFPLQQLVYLRHGNVGQVVDVHLGHRPRQV